MNPGDKLQIHIFDNRTAGALETQVRDLSTGRTGFMLASAKNGFMNTSIADCTGAPWSFRPLYSTAKTANQGGWAAANINVAYEVGHFTPCTRLQGFAPVQLGSYADPSWQFCRGPYENTGPPDGSQPSGDQRRPLLQGRGYARPAQRGPGPGHRLHRRRPRLRRHLVLAGLAELAARPACSRRR